MKSDIDSLKETGNQAKPDPAEIPAEIPANIGITELKESLTQTEAHIEALKAESQTHLAKVQDEIQTL